MSIWRGVFPRVVLAKAEFEESKHRRDEDGKFSSGGASGGTVATDMPSIEAWRETPFAKLASAQRGKPERAMIEVQFALGGGVLHPVVEHPDAAAVPANPDLPAEVFGGY